MQGRRVLIVGLAVALVALATWLFYTSVLDPRRDGQAREDTVAAEGPSLKPAPATDGTTSIDDGQTVVPPVLGGLRLTAFQSGETALAAVERLHGQALGRGLEAAWVAQYGNAGEATLWVSRSVDPADARALFERMTAKIAEGNSPFTGLTPMADPVPEGYELDGMGQKHFYFVADTELYWLAVDLDLSEAVLVDLAESALSVPAGVN